MFRGLLLGCIVGLALCGPASADALSDSMRQELIALEGTMSVKAQPEMAGGELIGCTLTFEAVQQDFKYLEGNFIKVSGTVGFMLAKGRPGVIVKVVAAELDPTLPNLGGKALPVSRAYLVGKDLSTNFGSLLASQEGINMGRFAVYNMDPGMTMIVSGVAENKITVAFAIGDGGIDIQMPIQIDVADIDRQANRKLDPNIGTNFYDCTSSLIRSVTESK
jgi:hypothetical protein